MTDERTFTQEDAQAMYRLIADLVLRDRAIMRWLDEERAAGVINATQQHQREQHEKTTSFQQFAHRAWEIQALIDAAHRQEPEAAGEGEL